MDVLRAMRTFIEVVDRGSLAGAARAMDVAPAVVTRLLAELEQHLGARLLHRTTRRLHLTEVGDAYLERCRQISADVTAAEALAGAHQQEPTGVLRVLAPPALAVHQLAPLLPAFHAAHPKVSLELRAEIGIGTVDESVDVTLILSRHPLEGDFVARLLARSEMVVCASPAYLNRRGRPSHPLELTEHDAMLPPGNPLDGSVVFRRLDGRESVPARAGAVRRPLLATTQLDVMLSGAVQGLGLAALPSFMAAPALQDGRLERVLPDWRLFSIGIWAAWPTRQHVPAATRAFIDHLLLAFGGRAADPWLGTEAPLAGRRASRRRDRPNVA